MGLSFYWILFCIGHSLCKPEAGFYESESHYKIRYRACSICSQWDMFVMIILHLELLGYFSSFHFFPTSNFIFNFCIFFYCFLSILFSIGHLLFNVFLLSHWLLCKERNKVNHVIVLLFVQHIHKEARKLHIAIPNVQFNSHSSVFSLAWKRISFFLLPLNWSFSLFGDLTFCHCRCR